MILIVNRSSIIEEEYQEKKNGARRRLSYVPDATFLLGGLDLYCTDPVKHAIRYNRQIM